jgi:hypothetical protein
LYVDSSFQGAVYSFDSHESRFVCRYGKDSKYFGKGVLNLLLIFFYLGGNKYGIPSGTVVTGILDMRSGKHDLHFLVGVELLPHAIVNIPNEAFHIGVFTFIFIIYFIFIIILFLLYNSYNIYLFLVLLLGKCDYKHY